MAKRKKVAKSTGKVDGRTREGKALKAKMQSGKRKKVEKASEVKVKRKYTKRASPTSKSKESYTQEELDKAQRYINSASYKVREIMKNAMTKVPRNQWNPSTHVVDGSSLHILNTEAVAKALGI